jgi:hypothetical protein
MVAEDLYLVCKQIERYHISSLEIADLSNNAHLLDGTAVHTILCEVPADIWWIGMPSRLITFIGFLTGLLQFPCPHWPITLLPHANTSQSNVNARQCESPTDISMTMYWSRSFMCCGSNSAASDGPQPRAAPLPQAKTCNQITCCTHHLTITRLRFI